MNISFRKRNNFINSELYDQDHFKSCWHEILLFHIMTANKKVGNRLVISVLVTIFVTYNIILYTQKTSGSTTPLLSEEALSGQVLWQDNNCTACHQFYGLGGYLGPDLTNIISNPNKGPAYAKAFFNSGIKSMPKFNFTPEEQDALVTFLTEVDQTGYYPNRNAKFDKFGWVTIEYK